MVKKDFAVVLVFIMVILFTSSFVLAITGSMGNARMILYPEVDGKSETVIEKTILVRNVNEVPINIKLETDMSGKDFIEIVDEEFSLDVDEEKKAKFLVKVKDEGRYEGRVNVFFKSNEEGEAGVVLSSTVIVIAKENQDGSSDFENNEAGSLITGSAVGILDTKKPIGMILLGIGTIVLIIVLIVLLNLSKKGKKKNEN